MSTKSDTWYHFVKKGSSGVCKYCHVEVKTCGNTTNLRNHLLRRHPSIQSTNEDIATTSTSKEKFGINDALSSTSSKEYYDSDLENIASSSVSLKKSKLNQLTIDSCVDNIKAFSEKVAAVVTDNGANIVKAVTIAFDKQKHLCCFAHTLNLVAQKPFEEEAADALRKAQNDIAVPLKLIQSVCTRWNSIYYQLVRFVKLSELLAPILLNYPKAPPMLTASQLDGIKDLINILKPMEAVTKEVSVDKFVTSSKIIPIVSCLLKTYSTMKTETDVGAATKNLILEELKKRFGTVEQVHVLAITTLLDPRFKKIHFSNRIACSRPIDKINSMIVASKKQLENKLSNEDSENNLECQLKEAEESNIWEFHNILVKNPLQLFQAETEGQGLQDELKHYLTQPVVDFKTTAPITYWYHQRNSLYSSITPIANKYFCIVGTSVPCERFFVAGNIATDERSRLDPE
ncbi:uncharacterized protein LOC103575560 [Microplitis demolitor]|uniref:uncharacterized protein LOC103575560 n=1 Tax=Microplitis demolitor TaxID=69319 RepID=UPI00235B5FED|nr:uncharacterized protein LOC103575560 [Microplitis demolitor]